MILSAEQQRIVEATDHKILVVAGAGAGKTRVITSRVQWLIDSGTSPGAVFVGTYTRKAAGEMRARLLGSGTPMEDLWLGTVHSLLWRMVGMFRSELGFTAPPTLFGQHDQEALAAWLAEELHLKSVPYAFSMSRRLPKEERHGALTREAKAFLQHYETTLRSWNAIDYDGLIDLGHRLADLYVCRKWIDQRFHAILLDEGQDISSAQWTVLEELFLHQSWFVVASTPQQVMSFAGVRRGDLRRYAATATVSFLGDCYRCPARILDAATAVLEATTDALNPPSTSEKAGDGPNRHWFMNGDEERTWLLEEVRTLLADGVKPQDIAILARTNAMVQEVADTLFSGQIPVQAVGRHDAFESPLAQLAICLLRAAVNPVDEWSFWRAARLVAAPKLDRARVKGLELRTGLSPWEAVCKWTETAGRGSVLARLVKVLKEIRSWLPDVRSAVHAVEGIVTLSRSAFPEMSVTAPQRLLLQREMHRLADACGGLTIDSFLGWLGGRAIVDAFDETREAVIVMTCHSAKGLEWPVVFVVGLEDGGFPTSSSKRHPDDLAEESRVAYVALTRARERLYLSGAATRQAFGRTVQRGPSPYLGLTEALHSMPDAPNSPSFDDLDLSRTSPSPKGRS